MKINFTAAGTRDRFLKTRIISTPGGSLYRHLNKTRGYSLLETLVALSILAVLVLMGTSFRIDNKRHQLEAAVDRINSALSLARFKAVHHQNPVRVTFRNNGYELFEYSETSSTWIKKNFMFLEGVHIEANNSPVFYPQGTVSNLATIRVGNERGVYSITIAITGRTKITRLE